MDPRDGTARIKLARRDGTFSWAVIDAVDLPLVSPYRWYEARRSNTEGYSRVIAKKCRPTTVEMVVVNVARGRR